MITSKNTTNVAWLNLPWLLEQHENKHDNADSCGIYQRAKASTTTVTAKCIFIDCVAKNNASVNAAFESSFFKFLAKLCSFYLTSKIIFQSVSFL
jgi:hypothetical protein